MDMSCAYKLTWCSIAVIILPPSFTGFLIGPIATSAPSSSPSIPTDSLSRKWKK